MHKVSTFIPIYSEIDRVELHHVTNVHQSDALKDHVHVKETSLIKASVYRTLGYFVTSKLALVSNTFGLKNSPFKQTINRIKVQL